ncbi:MAG: helix-turn-helix transcriptional regulator [Clostridia bacterium]|nr:helix-turn-helix transcriptional regulator [Clostridia bacterium]
MKGFGARLKAARKAKGLTQEQLAEKLHVHRTSCTKYERDLAEPTLETLVQLAAILEVTADSLLIPPTACPSPDRS